MVVANEVLSEDLKKALKDPENRMHQEAKRTILRETKSFGQHRKAEFASAPMKRTTCTAKTTSKTAAFASPCLRPWTLRRFRH